MSDLLGSTPVEPTQAEPTQAQEPVQNQDPQSFLDRVPEAYRSEKCFQDYKDEDGFFKSHLNLVKMMGQNPVKMPTPDSTPEEVASFYNQLGALPADQYKLGFKDTEGNELPAEQTQWIRGMAEEAKLTQQQLDVITKHYGEQEQSALAQQSEYELGSEQRCVDALKEDWGPVMYEQNVKEASELARVLGLEQDIRDAGKAHDPFVYKMLNKMRHLVSNDVLREGETINNMGSSIDSQIDEVMAKPGFMDARHPSHKSLQAEYMRLCNSKVQFNGGRSSFA